MQTWIWLVLGITSGILLLGALAMRLIHTVANCGSVGVPL